jgi:hypothetical protein
MLATHETTISAVLASRDILTALGLTEGTASGRRISGQIREAITASVGLESQRTILVRTMAHLATCTCADPAGTRVLIHDLGNALFAYAPWEEEEAPVLPENISRVLAV